MINPRVVVDGSNIATEGRTLPSLEQLDEAVRAFLREFPDTEVTVVVDATFGHRIAESERPTYEEAVLAGELVSPPAGAIGRGDAFVLSIASRADATVFSNDSFQEFHGQYTWLFDEGRLIGGKPIPGVGWVFVLRSPVRGVASRRSTQRATTRERRPTEKSAPKKSAPPKRSAPTGAQAASAEAACRRRPAEACGAEVADAAAIQDAARESRKRGGRRGARPGTRERPARVPRVREPPPGRIRGGGDRRSLLVARRLRGRRRGAVLPATAPHGRSAPEERQGAALGGGHPFLRGGVVRLAAQEHRPGDTRARDLHGPKGRNTEQPPPAEEAPSMAAPRKTAAKKKATAKRAPAKKKATAKKSTARKSHAPSGHPPRRRRRRRRRPRGRRPPPRRRRLARRARPSGRREEEGPRQEEGADQEEGHHAAGPGQEALSRVRRAGRPARRTRVATRSIPRPVAIVGAVRIATWNVNSLNARLPRVEEWLGVRTARRAVPPGDQARRHARSPPWPSRPSATRARTTARAGGTASPS